MKQGIEAGSQDSENQYAYAIESSGRSSNRIDRYLDCLGLDPESLKDKSILDVGSGLSLFGAQAARRGIDVTSVDPRTPIEPLPPTMSFQEQEEYRQRVEGGYILRAPAQKLPFDDESFDVVVAMQLVPWWLPREDVVRDSTITEMLRVLIHGGQMRLFPASANRETSEAYVPRATITRLQQAGFQISFEPAGTAERLVVIKPATGM